MPPNKIDGGDPQRDHPDDEQPERHPWPYTFRFGGLDGVGSAHDLPRPLKHLRQLRAPCTARIIHIVCNLLRALGCQFIEPIEDLGIAAPLINETAQAIAAVTLALVAIDAQHIELADEIAEYGGAGDGHSG